MKNIMILILLTGFGMSLLGCDSKENKLQAEKKSQRQHMIKKINSQNNNEPTKLP